MLKGSFQLLRIIIIDSFWRGKVNELNFSGHTQLEGTNGAGKTSLMRMLPLFYGMRPSDIVSKVDQSKNFADYYLPRESSMLVYEYQRPSVASQEPQICQMIATSDGRGIQYKLIDAPYRSEFFIGEDNKPLKIKEIVAKYQANLSNVHCSNFLGVDKYRQVIQKLRSGSKSKEIKQLQNRYSLSNSPCPHIDKVVNGTIEKNLDFDAVKRMLVSIVEDYIARSDITGSKEYMQLNKDEISQWLNDIQASRSVQKVADKIALWKDDFIVLGNSLTKLKHLAALSVDHHQDAKQTEQELIEQRLQAKKQREQSQRQLEKLKDELGLEIKAIKREVESDQAFIDKLDLDKQNFDDDDAPSYQLKADNKAQLLNRLSDVNQLIETFEGEIANIGAKFESMIAKLDLSSAKHNAKQQEQIALISQQANVKSTECEQQYQGQKDLLVAQQQQQFLTLSNAQAQLEVKLETTEHLVLSVQIPAPLNDKRLQCEQALKQGQQQYSEQLQAQSQQELHLAKLSSQREQALHQLVGDKRLLDELTRDYHLITQQINPEVGSLHHYLDNHASNSNNSELSWKDNIGRILSPQLLARQDLSPHYLEPERLTSDNSTADAAIYGLTIDLEQLSDDNALSLSESELRNEAERISDKLTAQMAQVEQQEALIAEQNKVIEQQNTIILSLKQQTLRLQQEIEQLGQQSQRNDVECRQALLDEKQKFSQQIEQLSAQLKKNSQQQADFNQQKTDDLHELNNQLLENKMVIESDSSSQLDTINEQLTSYNDQQKQLKKDYQQQLKKEINQHDPDGEIDKCIQEQQGLKKSLTECDVFAEKARKYQSFMQSSFSQRESLTNNNNQRQLALNRLNEQLVKDSEVANVELRRAKDSISRINEAIAKNEELLIGLERGKTQCDGLDIVAELDDNASIFQPEMVPRFIDQDATSYRAQKDRLSKAINGFSEMFRRQHAGSQLYSNWVKLVAENDSYQSSESVFKYQHAISDLLSTADQLQQSTGQLIDVNAIKIDEFYKHLTNFKKEINRVGRKLSDNVTALAQFEALAEININTISKIESLDYWAQLKTFSESYDMLRDDLNDPNREVPEELISAMRELSRVLPAEGVSLEHHELFDIEFVITEKGEVKRARNARQLKKISSTGLSYLAMLSLFAGILSMLRGNNEYPTSVILPVDELGELAAENIDLLLKMFAQNSIVMLSASPSTDRHILSLYQRHYKIKDSKLYHADIPQSRLDQLLAQRKQDLLVNQTTAMSGIASGELSS
ncbi:MAG: ATP-binding protein [Gammaproteobacteria bacterium]|nr:ATP-binding protein [Gammaproteobacteria bacterium]